VPEIQGLGARIHYEVRGEGEPTILFTHGWAASSRAFDGNVAPLVERHQVVTWDIRGHGESESPLDPARYSPALALGDMVGILDEVGAGPVVAIGHSLGGYLSLAFAIAHPERVAALVLLNTGPGFRNPTSRAAWNTGVERLAIRHEVEPGLLHASRGMVAQHDAQVLEGLPTIQAPVLILVGTEDDQYIAGSQYMADKIPSASLTTIPGAGHDAHITHAADFNRLVADFVVPLAGTDV